MYMQQVKTYTSGMLKGEARDQFFRDFKKMRKGGWHLHTLHDEGVGMGSTHRGHYTVVYEKGDELVRLSRERKGGEQ